MRYLSAFCAVGAALISTQALAAPNPNLPGCKPPEQPAGGERERKTPLPVPSGLRQIVRSSLYHYGVTTLGGRTLCIDTSWWNQVEWQPPSPDMRLLSFTWYGYETSGQLLMDRFGRGKAIEVGARPVFSPSRRLFAAVDQTESEFGSLSGLAVWRVTPTSVVEVVRKEDIPRMQDWRIDSWAGEACLNLSAVPLTASDPARTRRTRYVARPAARGWSVTRSTAGCPRS
jgi:hypothetical protein